MRVLYAVAVVQLLLWSIVTLLVVLAGVTKFLDVWFRPIQKAQLRERINDISAALNQSDPLVVIKTPLQLGSGALERIYGARLFSWKGFRRATLLSTALILFGLAVCGIASGAPFGIHEPPWTILRRTADDIEEAAKLQAKQKTDKPEVHEMLRRWDGMMLEFRTTRTQAIYSVAFFALVLISAVLSNFICVALSRKTLRDMAHATTLYTLFSLSFINFLISLLLYTTCLSVICTAAFPFLWVVPPLLFLCAWYWSWLLSASIALPLVVAALKFSPLWMEIVSVVATLPGILLLLVSFTTLIAFPFRRFIRRIIVEFLSRAVESDKGVLAFFAAAFTLVGLLVSVIPKLLFGSLGLS